MIGLFSLNGELVDKVPSTKRHFKLINDGVCARQYILGERLRESLKRCGWIESEAPDHMFINTCAFIEKVEKEIIKKIKKLDESFFSKLIIFGCLPIISSNGIETLKKGCRNEIIVVPKNEVREIARLLNLKKVVRKDVNRIYLRLKLRDKVKRLPAFATRDSYLSALYRREGVWYVKISDGCLGSCSFCAEGFVRSCLRSKPIKEVIGEIKSGLKNGYNLFTLGGDDTSVYGIDRGTNMAELLKEILRLKGAFKIFISGFNPFGLIKFDEMAELLKSKKIAGITVPLQSGSQKILKRMNRNYNIKRVMKTLWEIKRGNPKIKINTHFIVGFPSETEMDFEKTKRLLSSFPFDKVKIFLFSERPNTPASKMEQKIPHLVKIKRYRELRRMLFKECFKRLNIVNFLLNLNYFYNM